MSIYEEWISYVLTYHRSFINIDIIDVINKVYAFALATVCRFNDPDIFLAFVLFQLLVVVVKVSKLFRQNISVRSQIKSRFTELLLHPYYIKTHTIFACNFVRLRKLIYFLVFVQTFILVTLAASTRPK